MINLTRLNGQVMAVNPDLMKFIEQAPDTVITLITGEKLVVTESPDEVTSRVIAYRRSISPSLSSTPNLCCFSKSVANGAADDPEDI